MESGNKHPSNPERRDFLKKACACAAGGVVGAVPIAAGIRVFLDPLQRQGGGAEVVRIAALESIPADGIPRKFSIVTSRTDAWNKYEAAPIGAIYLRRTTDNKLEALNVVCPHAGCFVDFLPAKNSYFCPSHNSSFALDGSISDPASPSPRGLDTLEVEVRDGKEIWVKFQNFRAGHAEKTPA